MVCQDFLAVHPGVTIAIHTFPTQPDKAYCLAPESVGPGAHCTPTLGLGRNDQHHHAMHAPSGVQARAGGCCLALFCLTGANRWGT